MGEDVLTIFDENGKEEYRLLLIIEKEFKYIVYTNKENIKVDKDLYAIKVKSLNDNEDILPISDNEWKMIEQEYQKLLKK